MDRKTKRDIRRAFGDSAIEEVATLIERVNTLTVFINSLTALAQRGFLGRLKWLFLGR